MRSEDEPMQVVAATPQLPFSLAFHWLLLLPISPVARLLYLLLAAHVSQERGDGKVWPTRASLAKMLGFSKSDSVDRYLAELYGVGLVKMAHSKSAGNLRTRNIYTVFAELPADWVGSRSLGDWYSSNNLPETGIKGAPNLPEFGRKRASLKSDLGANGHSSDEKQVKKSPHNDVSAGQPVTRSRGVRNPLQGVSVTRSRGSELKELELKERSKNICSSDDERVYELSRFDEFWETYPRKVGKPLALRAWGRVLKADWPAVFDGLDLWVVAWQEQETPAHFIPHPSTWLRDERYNDIPSVGAAVGRERKKSVHDRNADVVAQLRALESAS